MPFQIIRGSLTTATADTIVNPANSELEMEDGACADIFHAAGVRRLKRACEELHGCPAGHAVHTPAFDLNARYIVHAVGPTWTEQPAEADELLDSACTQALRTAASLGAKTIALPLLSRDAESDAVFHAYQITERAIMRFLERHDIRIALVLSADMANSLIQCMKPPEDLQEFIEASQKEAEHVAKHAAHTDATKEHSEPTHGRHARAASSTWPTDDDSFSAALRYLTAKQNLTEAEICKRANLSRTAFANLCKGSSGTPDKLSALALAVALELSPKDADDLLQRAGLSLSSQDLTDVIVSYYLDHGEHHVLPINKTLFAYQLPLLGSTNA